MNRQTNWSTILLAFCLTLAATQFSIGVCSAQEDEHNVQASSSSSSKVIKVYALRYAVAEDVYQIASTILQDRDVRMTTDNQSNSLIVQGGEESHKMVLDLLESVDIKNSQENTASIVNLNEGSAREIASIVAELFVNNPSNPSSDVRVAVNEQLNSLILIGNKDDVETVRQTIKTILEQAQENRNEQVKGANCIVRITWLVDSSTSNATLFEPRGSLDELISGLDKDGTLKSAKTLTQVQTAVQVSTVGGPAKEFHNSSTLTADSNETSDSTNQISISANGSVRERSDGKYTLEIMLKLGNDQSNLPISTTIVLPKNHPVAFSISNIGSFKSAVVVEIIDGS